jgi:hypothetical protein
MFLTDVVVPLNQVFQGLVIEGLEVPGLRQVVALVCPTDDVTREATAVTTHGVFEGKLKNITNPFQTLGTNKAILV